MRNDFYIFAGYPHDFRNEMKINDGQYSVICDALFKSKGKFHFLEVDSVQKMKENKKKIEQYVGLFRNGAIEKHFGYFPTLIWLTTTELRRKQLTELCKDIPCVVYTIDDIR